MEVLKEGSLVVPIIKRQADEKKSYDSTCFVQPTLQTVVRVCSALGVTTHLPPSPCLFVGSFVCL